MGHSCRPRVKRGAQYPRFDFPEEAPGPWRSSPLRVDGCWRFLDWNSSGVSRRTVGGGPSPRKSAPRPLTPPRSEALGDADLDDLAAAQAQLDAILGAPPAYVASRQ